MKSLLLVPVLMMLVAIGAGTVRIRNPYVDEWKAFKLEHKKNYNKTQNAQHMLNFMKTKYKVAKHNQRYHRGELSYKLAINKFSDLTFEEFASTMTSFQLTKHSLDIWKADHKVLDYLESQKKEEYLLYPEPAVIDASHVSFKQYGGGVYFEENCSSPVKTLNHAVLVVGYGSDELGGDYWLVKNSFGSDWGENGYVRIARSSHTRTHCRSVAFFSIRPLVNNN